MAIFNTGEVDDTRIDWIILRDGGVSLYWRPEILFDDLAWLETHEYTIVSFDASEWASGRGRESERRMHESLKARLSFPDYYGKNLNALNDCMANDLIVPDAGGLVLVLKHYDRFKARFDSDEEDTAEVALSIFAEAVRYHMLFGRRLLILVQSDDPEITFGRLRGVPAGWNSRERMNKDRGV